METSPLICSANQWTGFYMITASAMKGLSKVVNFWPATLVKRVWEQLPSNASDDRVKINNTQKLA